MLVRGDGDAAAAVAAARGAEAADPAAAVDLVLYREECAEGYPVNALRNAALAAVATEKALLLDVDFLPSRRARDVLERRRVGARDAVVVPAFESRAGAAPPVASKAGLRAAVDAGDAEPFHATRFGRGGYAAGHGPTDARRWFAARETYEARYAEGFEPYVLVRAATCPRFDARFRGYGLNKVQHAFALDALGYRFVVEPDAWVVAGEHAASRDWRAVYDPRAPGYDAARRLKLQALYDTFKRETRRARRRRAAREPRKRRGDAALPAAAALAATAGAVALASRLLFA